MLEYGSVFSPDKSLSVASIRWWRLTQFLLWLIGLFIFCCLIWYPSLGILLFWNVLIPVAPALLVIASGLWRNICPLATTSLLPRKFNLSMNKIMPLYWQGRLQVLSVLSLYLIVPLRHALFNTNGLATAVLLFCCAMIAFGMGLVFDWKSGWCSSLCPVHPVEKLYGSNTIASMPNAHCSECVNCSIPCPDATPKMHPQISQKTIYHQISGLLIVGGLPGFIWGWFHVPDHKSWDGLAAIWNIYKFPLFGLLISLGLYVLFQQFIKGASVRKLIAFYAAAAVSCYYWYRIPALFGYGIFAEDGLLVNATAYISEFAVTVIAVLVTFFFFWWLLIRKQREGSWIIRPAFKEKDSRKFISR